MGFFDQSGIHLKNYGNTMITSVTERKFVPDKEKKRKVLHREFVFRQISSEHLQQKESHMRGVNYDY